MRNVIEDALERGGCWLDPAEVDRLLNAAGIKTPGGVIATDVNEAFEGAMCIGQPVALKAMGPTLLHKSDRGGVRLGLKDEC